MIVLSNLAAQTIQPGQAVTFDRVLLHSGCGECYNRQLPKTVKMKGNGIYKIAFSGNVSSPTAGAAMQLAVAVEGQPLVETTMNSTPSAENVLNNISTKTAYRVCCCDASRLSVINTGAVPVALEPNSAFVVERKS